MAEVNFNKALQIIGFVVGVLLIMYRKRFIRGTFRDQLRTARPSQKKQFEELRETDHERVVYKVGEVAAVIAGILIVFSTGSALFFPKIGQNVSIIWMTIIFSIFAFGGAGFIVCALSPFLTKNLDKYINEGYAELWIKKRTSPTLKEKLETMKSTSQINDPALQKLRRKALIRVVVLFVILFAVLLVGQYVIIKATS